MRTPNYHDFYQKALVPIGLNDRMTLMESESYHPEASLTHWLIAIEGVQLSQPKIYFHWKVSIYPATSDGDFNWKKPFFCSTIIESMDKAIELASSLVTFSKDDTLSSSILLEKIS